VEEVTDMLERAGFALAGLYEAYTFLPPGPKSERMFYVARAMQRAAPGANTPDA